MFLSERSIDMIREKNNSTKETGKSASKTQVAEVGSAYSPTKASRNGALVFSLVIALIVFTAVSTLLFFGFHASGIVALVCGIVAALLITCSAHIVMEWERVVITRFGAFHRVAGPGLVFMLPVVDQLACRIDMRIIGTRFDAEEALTSDLVSVNIDAVLFWMVWDARKACVEVEDYGRSVLYIAQTAMRDAIGRMSVSELAISRQQLDKELQELIERETQPWGIAVLSVKVRDIVIPEVLQDAMSLEAQAEREKNARLVLASAEQDISEMIGQASEVYANNDAALKVRTMHLLYDSIKNSDSTVVTMPTSFSDGFVPGHSRGE